MKKYASLLFLALLLNGCDDGDLTVDTIDFDDATITAASCSTSTTDNTTPTLIYKLKSQEALIIQLPAGSIPNDATPVGEPLEFDINNTTIRAIYRAYNGTVAADNICGTIPPTTPSVTEEWQATAGKIEVVSTATVGDPSTTDGSTRITGYSHVITLRNITFQKPSGPQVEEELVFGTYTTSPDTMNLTFDSAKAAQCPTSKQVYNFTSTSALTIDNIDPTLITKTVGTRTGVISATTNKVAYTTFTANTGTVTSSYFCNTTVPATPSIKGVWDAVADQAATIEVTTTKVGTTSVVYTHTITLKKVTLKKGNSKFYLADSFVLGVIQDQPVTE